MSPSGIEALDMAKARLAELLAKMGVEAEVSVASEDPPQLDITTESAGTLIGARGEGIRALQHLLRLWLVRAGHDLPVVVDIDGYRAKREQQLTEMAKQKADEVRQSGRLTVLAPMSSYERRVVHTTLAEEDGVTTESLGEGQDRRVMIKKEGATGSDA